MEFGVVIPSQGLFGDAGAIRAFIAAAEDLGYHTAWFGDHIIVPAYAAHLSPPNWFDALACCLVGAGLTTRLRFGTDVLVLPYRNSVELAHVVASADQLCDGRLTLGAGIGYIRGEFEAVGAPRYEERGRVTTEYLQVLRTLWESGGEEVSFDGRYVQLRDVHQAPAPLQDPFPLFVGGNGDRAIERAALHGNGWHPLFPTPEKFAAGRAAILEQRERAGITAPFHFAMSCPGTQVVLDTDEPAAPADLSGYGDVPDEYGYAPPFPTTSDGRAMFVGNPDELVDDVAAYAAAGVEHLALRFWTVDPTATVDGVIEQMERWQQLVAPNVK